MKKIWFIVISVAVIALAAWWIIEYRDKGDTADSRFPGRVFRYRVLENGLKVLLIEDPRIDNAMVSVSFKTGSIDNETVFGLAHLIEHMVFLGNKKHPETDAFTQFVQSHGGSHNAYTSDDVTNYFFQINDDYLLGALDRFVTMLFLPTFTSKIEDEVKSVNSEHLGRMSSGWAQGNYLMRQTLLGDSPRGTFSTGNLETLKDVSSEQLLRFHQQHYHPDNMAWVMISPRPLSEQEKTVRSWLSDENDSYRAFKSSRLPKPSQHPSLLLPYKQERIRLQNLKTQVHGQKLSIEMIIQKNKDASWSQSELSAGLSAVSRYLGDEREGTLYDNLIKKRWITSLYSSDQRWPESNMATLGLTMDVTKEGLQHVSEILSEVVNCILFLKKNNPSSSFFKEVNVMKENIFLEKERDDLSFVTSVSDGLLRDYSWEDGVFIRYHASTPDVFSWWVSQISLDPQLWALVVQNGFSADDQAVNKEWQPLKYHAGSQYASDFIDPKKVESSEFHYPKPNHQLTGDKNGALVTKTHFKSSIKLNEILKQNNRETLSLDRQEFLPENRDDVERQLIQSWGVFEPVSQENHNGLEWVHHAGPVFATVRRDRLRIDWLYDQNTMDDQVLREMIAAWLNWRLHDDIYDALMIHNEIHFDANSHGYQIQLKGNPNQMLRVHQRILKVLNNLKNDEFNSFYQQLPYLKSHLSIRYLTEKNQNISQSMFKLMAKMMVENHFLPDEKSASLDKWIAYFQSDDVPKSKKKQKLIQSILDRYVLVLLMSPYHANTLKESISESYQPKDGFERVGGQKRPQFCRWVPGIGQTFVLNKRASTNGNLQLRRLSSNHRKSVVGLKVLQLASGSNYFDRLRTKQGLSYVASLFPYIRMNQPMLINILGESRESAELLSRKNNEFFQDEQHQLYDSFDTFRSRYRNILTEAKTTQSGILEREFSRLFYPDLFLSDSESITVLDKMTVEEWKRLIENVMGEKGERGFLEIQMNAQESRETSTVEEMKTYRLKSEKFCA